MIISLLNQKGGVGKTTLSINLAAAFANSRLKTLLVDADPQGSAMAWSSVRDADPVDHAAGDASDQGIHVDPSRHPNGTSKALPLERAPSTAQGLRPSVVGMAKATLHKDLPNLAANYAMTIIDGAPRVNELARSAILASDLVLIPAQPSPLDIWASDDIVSLIIEAQIYRPNLCAAFVINRKIANTVIGRDVNAAFDDSPFDVMPISIGQRVIFAETLAAGRTVFDHDPKCAAAQEVMSLARYVIKKISRSAA